MIMKTKNLFNVISVAALISVSALLTVLFYFKYLDIKLFVVLIILTMLISSSIKIADQWEKAVLLRMGKYIGLKGPGLFFIVPIIDHVIDYIDHRVRMTGFNADQTLTKDTVPVNVVATLYWTVWDVEKAEKFAKAKASESYLNNPVALQLRAMNLICEGLKTCSMIMVPSSALDTMNLFSRFFPNKKTMP